MVKDTQAPSKVATQAEHGQRPFGEVLARNITTLVELRRQAERKKGLQDRIADAITCFTGSMTFVYLHALLFGSWILVNLGWTPIPRFDSSFVVLAMVASVEAIFLSTFVLISQNRMMAASDKRAELDLQISLLSEHEITKVLELLDAIAERLGVKRAPDPDLEEAKQDVDPASVMEAIEEREQSPTRADELAPAAARLAAERANRLDQVYPNDAATVSGIALTLIIPGRAAASAALTR